MNVFPSMIMFSDRMKQTNLKISDSTVRKTSGIITDDFSFCCERIFIVSEKLQKNRISNSIKINK